MSHCNMRVILNEDTGTAHKRISGASDMHTECGVTHQLSRDQLQILPLEQAETTATVSKCGRCFEGGGGY